MPSTLTKPIENTPASARPARPFRMLILNRTISLMSRDLASSRSASRPKTPSPTDGQAKSLSLPVDGPRPSRQPVEKLYTLRTNPVIGEVTSNLRCQLFAALARRTLQGRRFRPAVSQVTMLDPRLSASLSPSRFQSVRVDHCSLRQIV